MELKEIAARIGATGMHCNCDLDRWQPEPSTGHSWACRIHKAAVAAKHQPHNLSEEMKVIIAAAPAATIGDDHE